MGAQATFIMLLPQNSASPFVQLVQDALNCFVNRFVVQCFVGILENQTDGITLFICGQFITLVNIKKERIHQ